MDDKDNSSRAPFLAFLMTMGFLLFILWSGQAALYFFLPVALWGVYESVRREPRE